MIKKLTNEQHTLREMFSKINEVIDVINAITIDVDGVKCVDGSKKAEPADSYEEHTKSIDFDDVALKLAKAEADNKVLKLALQVAANALESIRLGCGMGNMSGNKAEIGLREIDKILSKD